MSEHEGTVGPVWSPDVDTDSDTNKYSARATPHLLTLKENWISRVQNVLSASHTLTLMSMNLCMGSYHCSSTTLASRPQHRNTQPRCGLPADNRFSSISTDRSEICLLWSSQGFFKKKKILNPACRWFGFKQEAETAHTHCCSVGSEFTKHNNYMCNKYFNIIYWLLSCLTNWAGLAAFGIRYLTRHCTFPEDRNE